MDDNSSDSSIVEIEIKKKPPPVVHLDEEEIVLNVNVAPSRETCLNPISPLTVAHLNDTDKIQVTHNPDHWTKDMIRFYNDDWGDEESFVVKNIQEEMNKHPDLWKVSNKDILSFHSKKKHCKLRCWNCCQHGHVITNCPDPLNEQKCHMCGGLGHSGKSCPNAKCLNCGAASRIFINMCNKCIDELRKKCSRCNLDGHYFINCTDHWRKYHYTTKTTEIKKPEHNVNKPLNQLWCCNCGRKGHHQTKCNFKKNSPAYPDALPFIASYEDLFTSPVENTESAKKKRYFESESTYDEKGLSWSKKIENIRYSGGEPVPLALETTTPQEVTVLFEGKERRPVENPFRNWKEWFTRGRRRNKSKSKSKGKRQRLIGNWEAMRGKKNTKEHRTISAPENKNGRHRKETVFRQTDKRAVKQNNYR